MGPLEYALSPEELDDKGRACEGHGQSRRGEEFVHAVSDEEGRARAHDFADHRVVRVFVEPRDYWFDVQAAVEEWNRFVHILFNLVVNLK